MNHPIDYRAWNKETEQWMPTSDVQLLATREIIIPTGSHAEEWYQANHIIELSFFIGLKDHADQEAYESDIIGLYDDFTHELLSKHEIIWGGKQYPAWTLKPGLQLEQNVFSYLGLSPSAPEWLILGNTYENPELLETEEAIDEQE